MVKACTPARRIRNQEHTENVCRNEESDGIHHRKSENVGVSAIESLPSARISDRVNEDIDTNEIRVAKKPASVPTLALGKIGAVNIQELPAMNTHTNTAPLAQQEAAHVRPMSVPSQQAPVVSGGSLSSRQHDRVRGGGDDSHLNGSVRQPGSAKQAPMRRFAVIQFLFCLHIDLALSDRLRSGTSQYLIDSACACLAYFVPSDRLCSDTFVRVFHFLLVVEEWLCLSKLRLGIPS